MTSNYDDGSREDSVTHRRTAAAAALQMENIYERSSRIFGVKRDLTGAERASCVDGRCGKRAARSGTPYGHHLTIIDEHTPQHLTHFCP